MTTSQQGIRDWDEFAGWAFAHPAFYFVCCPFLEILSTTSLCFARRAAGISSPENNRLLSSSKARSCGVRQWLGGIFELTPCGQPARRFRHGRRRPRLNPMK